MPQRLALFSSLVAVVLLTAAICSHGLAQSDTSAGFLLSLEFDPAGSSLLKRQLRAKGVYQRSSFNGQIQGSRKHLQIAFVVDGTESMGVDIESVRQSLRGMIYDLRRAKEDDSRLEFALVVFRDSGAASGPVTVFDSNFNSDAQAFEKVISKVQPETGAPRFHEVIDQGIHAAIDQLAWTDDDETGHWLIVFGDAPPYPEGHWEAEHNTGRRYPTAQLIQLARDKDIRIHCLLCSTGFVGKHAPDDKRARAVYETVLPDTRDFMSQLAKETQGVFWDLSRPDLRQALVDAAQEHRAQFQTLAHIAPQDIDNARMLAARGQSPQSPVNRVRLAVLPHRPLRQLGFSPDDEGVQTAAALRSKFAMIPQIEVRNPQVVAEKAQAIRSRHADDARLLQQLATELHVDYILWGTLQRTGDKYALRTACYKRVDGGKVAEAEVVADVKETTSEGNSLGETHLVSAAAEQLAVNIASALRQGNDRHAMDAFSQLEHNDELATAVAAPISSSVRAHRQILAGLDALETALALPQGDRGAAEHLQRAERWLKAGLLHDSQNALAHALLASCYYNQAERDVATDKVQAFYKSLEQAYRFRENCLSPSMRMEIEADYALFCQKDVRAAIRLYEALADARRAVALGAALRAHWMLAGIYCGDWRVPRELVNTELARHHIIQVMALWPDSQEAEFYRESLQYDEEKGTRYPRYPKQHRDFPELASP